MEERDDNESLEEDGELTAQPKRTEQELTGGRRGDADLTVDPDDLGRHFLREAVEQSELPSVTDPEPDEALLSGSAIRDTATDAGYGGARTEWEAMVDRVSEIDPRDCLPTTAFQHRPSPDEVEVASGIIRDGSLFDLEPAAPEEGPRTPRIQTEDRHRQRTAGGSAIVLGGGSAPGSKWGRARMLVPIAFASFAFALAWRLVMKRAGT